MDNTIVFEAQQTFDVPTKIVDLYLNAPDIELRLILFLLRNRNSSFIKKDIMNAVCSEEDRLEKAFEYWCGTGILYKASNKYTLERPQIQAAEIMKYSADQISKRIEKDDRLRFLYDMAEKALSKPLSTSDSSVILALVDWNGLPPEVAAMLIQYAADQSWSLSKIQKLGIEWAEKEINTYEKADEYISKQLERKNVITMIGKALGFSHRALTEAESKTFSKWSLDFGFTIDTIKYAYDKTIQGTGKYSYQYMDKILSNWNQRGLKSVDDILNNDNNEKPKAKKTGKRYESKIKDILETSPKDDWDFVIKYAQEDKNE